MTNFLISPAERPPITSMGKVSSLPERMGSDILWDAHGKLFGVQRKTVTDLIASVRDGRLGRELQEMQQLSGRYLVIEGMAAWTSDGLLNNQHVMWTLNQQWGVELSIQHAGVNILRSRNPLETVNLCEYLRLRSEKEPSSGSSLLARGNPPRNGWGRLDDRNTAIHLLSGIPGISTELAGRIFDHFGKCPIGLTVDVAQLEEVPGLGPKRIGILKKVLGG